MKIQERVTEILKRLRREYPEPETALNFKNPFELLVATILSAQAADVHVNRVTESLFKKYKSVKDYADASPGTFQRDISSINFYKTKAKNIQGSAKIEKDLIAATLREEWGNLSHLLISHGRKTCQAKKPKHDECVLYDICPSKDI